MQPTIVFIDAKYLQIIGGHLHRQSPLPKYDINQFAITLARNEGLWRSKVYYYTAPPYQSDEPTPDEILRRSRYDKFTNKLKKIPNFFVQEGRCQKVDGEYHQKGVDTHVTMDLMTEAIANRGKTFILVACDTDFVPVIKKIRETFGIVVVLYYYNDYIRKSRFSMSNHILTVCDKSVLITREMFANSQFPRELEEA